MMILFWILRYIVLAVLLQLAACYGLLTPLSTAFIVQQISIVGASFMCAPHSGLQDNGGIHLFGTQRVNTMIQYTMNELLDLKAPSAQCKVPCNVHSFLKQNGRLRGRGRRASKCTRRKNFKCASLKNNTSEKGIHICLWNAQSVRNKTLLFSDFVLEHDVDIFFLTETWLREDDAVVIG